jgi:hypothetical protein
MVEKDKVALVGDKSGNLDPERRNQRSSTSFKYNPKHAVEFEYKCLSKHLAFCHVSWWTIIFQIHLSLFIFPMSNMTALCVRVCYCVCVCVFVRV